MGSVGIGCDVICKIRCLGVFGLVQSAIVIYFVNLKAPFHQGIFLPILVEVYITLALTTLAGLMLGLAISALAPNTGRAMSFVPLALIPQVLFSAFILNLHPPLFPLLRAHSPPRS